MTNHEHRHTGLCCTAGRVQADDKRITRDDAATSNVTDLRRARQKARSVVQDIVAAIEAWMNDRDLRGMLTTAAGARRANRAITEIASQHFRDDLLGWLLERNRIAMGRAVRDASGKMAQQPGVEADDLVGADGFDQDLDQERLNQIRQVDAGLLYDTELAEELGLNEPLAEELGDDVTRQLRRGIADDESVQELAQRVAWVVNDTDTEGRQAAGVAGQSKRSKAELIAHDSVQDAYNQAARGRYLRNGFRFGTYDATIDTKTTDLCRRMDEVVIDLRDQPWLIPPLHPYCRSGIRPAFDPDQEPVDREDIADGFLNTIMQTKSYRPPANAAGDFRPTALTPQDQR